MQRIPTTVLDKASDEMLIDLKNKLEYSIHKLYSDLCKPDELEEDSNVSYFLNELNDSSDKSYHTRLIRYINSLENHLSKAINSLSADETIKLLTRGQGI